MIQDRYLFDELSIRGSNPDLGGCIFCNGKFRMGAVTDEMIDETEARLTIYLRVK